MTGRILIVDPIATNRILMGAMLNGAFFKTDFATSASEAIAQFRLTAPDLVLVSDLGACPVLQEIFRGLKDVPSAKTIPVVLMSEAHSREERLSAMRMGASEVLSKPVPEQVLLARLRSLLRQQEAQSALPQTEDIEGFNEPAAIFAPAARILIASEHSRMNTRRSTMLKPWLPYQMTILFRVHYWERQ